MGFFVILYIPDISLNMDQFSIFGDLSSSLYTLFKITLVGIIVFSVQDLI